MEIRKGYKQTEISVIPEDWVVKKISEIANPVRGGSPRPAGDPKYFNGHFIPWLTVASLTNIPTSQIHVSQTDNCLTEAGSKLSRTLEKETLIIANSGATLGVAKLLAIKCCANDGIAALLDFDKKIDKTYLVYFINTQIKYLRDVVATGNGQPNLNTGLIGNLTIPLPPTKSEQTAIATALSDADSLICNLEKLVEKKKAIKQGTMQELMKPKDGWEKKKLVEIGKCLRGVSYDPEEDLELYENDKTYSLLRSNIIQEGLIDFDNLQFVRKKCVKDFQVVKESDIIICMANGSKQLVGKAAIAKKIIEQSYTFGAFMGCFRINKEHNPDFIFALMETKQYRNYIDVLLSGSSINNLNPSSIESMEFKVPELNIQNDIAKIVIDLQENIIRWQIKLKKLKLLKQGMMQVLLTGKIRLV